MTDFNPLARVGQPWDATQDTALRALFDACMSIHDIAHALGRTVPGVMARCERIGLTTREQS
jgi:hypothetical protein